MTAEATGALFINSDGVAADLDLALTTDPSSVFAQVFTVNAVARLTFNTTSKDQEVEVSEKLQKYLPMSDHIIARVVISQNPNYFLVQLDTPLRFVDFEAHYALIRIRNPFDAIKTPIVCSRAGS